jgi:hypothetical protein
MLTTDNVLGNIPTEEDLVDAMIVATAKIAHEVNKAYCEAFGDTSQLSWNDAPEWQKISAIKGVEFLLTNPDAKPSASHESWLAEKEKDGWKYGSVKNPEKKEHPCYVPYDKLPNEQKAKDYLFGAVVRNVLELMGFRLKDNLPIQ